MAKISPEIVIYVIAIIAVFALAAIAVLLHAPKGGGNQISVSATGFAYAYPAESTVSITVNASANTTANATSLLSSRLSDLDGVIRGYVNGNLSKVSTSTYYTYMNYNKTAYKYTSTESLTVNLPDINATGAFLGAVSAMPGVYVTSASPTLSSAQLAALKGTAISDAIANATAQAKAALPGFSVQMGNITISSYSMVPIRYGLAASGASPSPSFYGGRQAVTAAVSAVFFYSR